MLRIFDLVFSSILLVTLIPLIIILYPLLKITGEGEVFYLQERVGLGGSKFKVIKFATMMKNSMQIGAGSITVANDPRVLPVGKILRKTKVNELPQFINVLKGEMSFIGPRPHAEIDLKGVKKDKLEKILTIRPGLSGIASIIFRNEDLILHDNSDGRTFYDNIIAPYKADLEIWYIDNRNIYLYLLLIILTIFTVLGLKQKVVFKICRTLPPIPDKLLKYF
jgi:lipopolysaccharide/colanic/teichoic acid biosynthesis glycosyltransferase